MTDPPSQVPDPAHGPPTSDPTWPGPIAGLSRAVSTDAAVIEAVGLRRTFGDADRQVVAVDSIDLAVPPGTIVAVHGRSGSGKTTLLNLLGGLDRPDRGRLRVAGVDPTRVDDDALAVLRRTSVAFVFQNFGLVDVLSASENVGLAGRAIGLDDEERRARVEALLEVVGLAPRADHLPAELSGGERQRVAVARALVTRAPVLVADEPTGQLDPRTGARVIETIRSSVVDHGIAAVVATHDRRLLEVADETIELADGVVVDRAVRA